MFNVCAGCGQYRVDKQIRGGKPYAFAVCPMCNHSHRFRRLPLLIVTGASGTGKSAVLPHLLPLLDGVIALEGDILLLGQAVDVFCEMWLRVAKNINQSAGPTLLLGGAFNRHNIERCVERRYFAAVHYLALVCEEETLRRRLLERPDWRGFRDASGEQQLADQLDYNRWLQQQSGLMQIDTTTATVAETAVAINQWLEEILHSKSVMQDMNNVHDTTF